MIALPCKRLDHPQRARRVLRDEHGAIALMALFMAVFLVGLLGYVQGIGSAIVQRERLQDAADAVAFSSAALHARGMNVLALLNMLMAALLAILVALKLVELLTSIAIIAIAILAFFAPGAAAAIPPLADLRSGVRSAHAELSPEIHTALEAMHVAARGVRTLVPVAAQARVSELALQQPGTPALAAFAVPMRAALPTRDGSFGELCGEAGEYVADLTGWVLKGARVPRKVRRIVSGAMSDLVRDRADWFCGDERGEPPKTTVTHRYAYPLMPERVACEAVAPDDEGYDSDVHARLCDEAERAESASKPDASGNCAAPVELARGSFECTDAQHPYHVRAALAREACSPQAGGEGDDLHRFEYQERIFTRRYAFERARWKRLSSDAEERARRDFVERRVESPRRPCGRPDAAIDSDWNPGDANDDPMRLPPVCSDAAPPSLPGRPGEVRELTHHEVARVFGCRRRVKHTYAVQPSDGGRPADAENEMPQRLIDAAPLGAEAFQVRAGVLGTKPSAGAERLLRIALWRQQLKEPVPPSTIELGRVALAQAEYYFDAGPNADPGSFMWSMGWRARLRRFARPSADADASLDPTDAADFEAGALTVSWIAACEAAAATTNVAAAVCCQLGDVAGAAVH